MILAKGSQPIKLGLGHLRSKLSKLWEPIGNWRIIPLGKRYYEFSFSSAEDLRSVWDVGAWNLHSGILRLSQWKTDFNPKTHVESWIRLYELPQEYWRPKILLENANGIGTPIALDETTGNRFFGHYARVLIDVNLTAHLPSEIMVERENFAFYVVVNYEKLPLFCSYFHSIGHEVGNCKKKSIQDKTRKELPYNVEKHS